MLGRGLESLIPKKANSSDQDLKNDSLAPSQASGNNLKPFGSFPVKPAEKFLDFKESAKLAEHEETWPHIEPKNFYKINHANSVSKSFSPRSKDFEKKPPESIFHIEVDKIKPNPYQPRKEFNQESLSELSQSIREFGIIQPLIVSKNIRETEAGTDVEYQLIAGERRLMAAKLIGLERVPAIIKKVDEHRVKLELALIENIQRRDLSSLEEARAYSRLQDEFGLTQREIASKVGKSREVVANTLRLLNLPAHIQKALSEGKINDGQARALLGISNFEEQNRFFQNLLENKMSVRALRQEVNLMAVKAPQADPESNYWEKQLEEKLGAPVKVLKQGGKGKMVVQFFSDEEWRGILEKLLGENRDL